MTYVGDPGARPRTKAGRAAAVLAVALVVTLACGCSTPDASPDAARTSAVPRSTSHPDGTGASPAPGGDTATDSPDETADPPDTATDPATSRPSTSDGAATTDDREDVPLEMPEETAATTHLSELVEQVDDGPLVGSVPGRPRSASGRLVRGYPVVLRPARLSRVEDSSVAPAGTVVQVGLTASTTLAPELVLASYRQRLARRGMIERASPSTAEDGHAAAFRRGRSVVTVIAVSEDGRTTYAVHAVLVAG